MLALLCTACGAVAFADIVIVPGDLVAMTCAEDNALNGSYTITDSGQIILKYIGAVDIGGLTEKAAADKIGAALIEQQILRTATIVISVDITKRPPVTCAGAVSNPGDVAWRDGLSLSDVLKATGPTSAADLADIRISHPGGAVESVNASKTPPDNPLLGPGDRVFVPLQVGGQDITVLGAVMKPGIVKFRPGIRLSEAIEAAGGFRLDSEKTRVAVTLRAGGSSIIDTTLAENDVALSPGDQVVVPIRAANENVYVRGAVSKPGMVPFAAGMTISKVVDASGPVQGARLDKVKLIRKGPDGKSKTIKVDLAKVTSGEAPDEPLLAGDIVDVPYPARGMSFQDKMQLVSLAIFVFFLLKR